MPIPSMFRPDRADRVMTPGARDLAERSCQRTGTVAVAAARFDTRYFPLNAPGGASEGILGGDEETGQLKIIET